MTGVVIGQFLYWLIIQLYQLLTTKSLCKGTLSSVYERKGLKMNIIITLIIGPGQ